MLEERTVREPPASPGGSSGGRTASTGLVRRLDRLQRRYRIIGFGWAVIKKYGDDGAGAQAALIAYYGFFSLFPLLLLLATLLGWLLGGNPEFQQRILNSAIAKFPIIGTSLHQNVHVLTGNGVAMAVGVVGSLWGGLRVAQAAQNAMNTIWNVPRRDWPTFTSRRLRALAVVALVGAGLVMSTVLPGLARPIVGNGRSGQIVALTLSSLVYLVVIVVAFEVLTVTELHWRDVIAGAVVATAGWDLLQALGGWFLTHALQRASVVYGFFALVIGLLTWIALNAAVMLFAAEINVVRHRRLWPRPIIPRGR